jgi:lipoprotein-anchoring transpeptidase ErfK/SrfK
MQTRILQLIAASAAIAGLALTPVDIGAGQAARQKSRQRPHAAQKPAPLPCGDYMAFQVLLDRQGFSPGQIDGRPGANFAHALAAFQNAKKLTATPQPDCEAWRALEGESTEATTTYTITDPDVKGPFEENIPRNLVEQSKLPALAYQSPAELIGERFHASPALLQRLNPGTTFTAGQTIKVPNVTPFDVNAKPTADQASAGVEITVSKDDSALRAAKPDGTAVFFAPVTTGSEHDPLPTGDYKVIGVSWMPAFHYNPDLFWDAKATDEKATIKPGPNNPVGVLWISLSLEHYGMHGTPEPGNVGHTESHGCIRLTNWDAARVAALVKPGTRVLFR